MNLIQKNAFQQKSLLLKIALIAASISVACSCGEVNRKTNPEPIVPPKPPLLTAIENSSDGSDKATVAERAQELIKKITAEQDKNKQAQQEKASKKHYKEKAKKILSPIRSIKKAFPNVGLRLKRIIKK
jgi:hypothetical protein